MDKMKMETPNLAQENFEKLAALFPNCVTERQKSSGGGLERAIDFEKLKQMLADHVREGEEAYEFTWVGKKAAIVEANRPIRRTLRPCVEESKDWDTTQNLYIEGDNLEALKLLQESYLGKVKMIYIDPPYNTGNDFIYNDDFKQSFAEYEEDSGVVDEDGNRMKVNHGTDGRFHSKWCSMIYSRLLIARNLLSDDGLIFISIDDNEVENLKIICNELFGPDNFVTQITWEKRFTRSNNSKMFASLTEYVLVYRRSSKLTVIRESRSEKNDSIYKNPDNDPRGVWTSVSYVNPASREQRPNLCYTIENPITGEKVNHPTNAWKYEYATYQQHVAENKLYWGKNGENKYPRLKKFLSEMDGGVVPANLWYYKEVGTTDAASKDLEKLIGRGIFDFPKPIALVEKMLDIATTENDIVMDFFSGSGTTAHAVMDFNQAKNRHLKYILVQVPEIVSEKSEAKKKNLNTICEIGKERIRLAGSNYESVDTGFRVLKIDSSNMNDVYYGAEELTQDLVAQTEDNIKSDRTSLDLLFGCLVDWGVPLSLPYTSETIDGCTVHDYADGALIACFDRDVPEFVIRTIAKRQPERAVFRDSSFADSPAKINVTEIFKRLSPDTDVRVL